VLSLVVGGECVTILASWAALNPPFIITGIQGCILPWSIFNHRAFDGKKPLIMICYNEKERPGFFHVQHSSFVVGGRRSKQEFSKAGSRPSGHRISSRLHGRRSRSCSSLSASSPRLRPVFKIAR
jgi:hypothetical protein